MALVSYGFGFFCAVLLLLYYIVPGRFQWRILLAASVLFYGFAGPLWILYPAASSVSVWYLARKIGSMTDQYRNWVQKDQPDRTQKKAYNQRLKARQKRFLILGLLLNFGILAVLKYTNFLLSNVEGILHLAGISGEMEYADWVLPLGISYYTFQSMGYLIDVYHQLCDALGKQVEPNFGPDRAGDIRDSNADISKARELLHYDPEYDFAKGIHLAINWYKENL